jgi:PleD family two-component response regulator
VRGKCAEARAGCRARNEFRRNFSQHRHIIRKPIKAQPSKASQRPRILLADDNADMRDYVQRLLSEEYEVETVVDGEAA